MHQMERRKYCYDIVVICRADHWTDYKLLRAKVVLKVLNSNRQVLEDIVLLVTSLHAAYNKSAVEKVAHL